MLIAKLEEKQGLFLISIDDYRNNRLGDILNKLSIDGHCIVFPTGNIPTSDWTWQFDSMMLPAVEKLLNKFEVCIVRI